MSEEKKENGMQHKEIITNNTQRVRISTKEIKAREVQYIDTKLKTYRLLYRKSFIQRTRFSPLYIGFTVCVLL